MLSGLNPGRPIRRLAIAILAGTLGLLGVAFGEGPGSGSTVHAAQEESGQASFEASLQPNVVELSVAPGESAEFTLRLSYLAGSPCEATVGLFDFFSDPSGATRVVPAGSVGPRDATLPVDLERWASAAWLVPPVGPIRLQAGDERPLRFKVSAPADAEPGERRALVLVTLAGPPTGSGVSVIPRLGARIYTTVLGQEVRRVEDVRLAIAHRGLVPLGAPVEFATTLRNAGTTHVRSRGTVVLRDWLGGPEVTVPLPDRRVLPGEAARLVGEWPGPPWWRPVGVYSAQLSFDDEAVATAVPAGEHTVWAARWHGVGTLLGLLLSVWAVTTSGTTRGFLRKLRKGLRGFAAAFRAS